MKRLITAGVALGVVALGVGVWASRTSVAPPTPTASLPHQPDDMGARFAVRTDRYAVTWMTQAVTQLPLEGDASMHISASIEGDLVITTESVSGSEVIQVAELRDLTRLVVQMDDQVLPLTPADLEGVPVRIFRDARGELVDLAFPPDVAPAARNTLSGLMRATSVEQPGDGERFATFGIAIDQWDGNTRTTTGYTSVDGAPGADRLEGTGSAQIVVGSNGRLLTLSATDHATAQQGDTVLLTADDAITLAWSGLGAHPVTLETSSLRTAAALRGVGTSDALRDRAGHMTAADVVAGLQSYEPGTDTQDLLWRGTAAIATDAAALRQVADTVSHPDTPHAQRELGLDLLANAPSADAQTALLRALESEQLRSDRAYPAYLQRVGFVPTPGPAMVEWTQDHLDDEDSGVRRAAAATLGAVARRLSEAGQHEQANDALQPLRTASWTAPEDRGAALMGLGNAAQPDDLTTLLQATTEDTVAVRAAAMHALRHYEDPEALTALRGGLADASGVVQRAALSRLAEHVPSSTDLAAARDVVVAGQVNPANLQLAIVFFSDNPGDIVSREALAALLEHPHGDASSRARIRALLTQ